MVAPTVPKAILVLLFITFLCSCSPGPVEVAKKFVENLARGNVEQAKRYATKSTQQLIDAKHTSTGIMGEHDFVFEVELDTMIDDTVWVAFVNYEYQAQDVAVVKVDGDWLVHLNEVW